MSGKPIFLPDVECGETVRRIEASLEEFSGLFFLDFFLDNDGRLTLSISYPDVVHLIGVLLTLANRMRMPHQQDNGQAATRGAPDNAAPEPATVALAESSGLNSGFNRERLTRYLRLAMLIYSRLHVEGDEDDRRIFEICLTNASRLAGSGPETVLCD